MLALDILYYLPTLRDQVIQSVVTCMHSKPHVPTMIAHDLDISTDVSVVLRFMDICWARQSEASKSIDPTFYASIFCTLLVGYGSQEIAGLSKGAMNKDLGYFGIKEALAVKVASAKQASVSEEDYLRRRLTLVEVGLDFAISYPNRV